MQGYILFEKCYNIVYKITKLTNSYSWKPLTLYSDSAVTKYLATHRSLGISCDALIRTAWGRRGSLSDVTRPRRDATQTCLTSIS